MLNKPLLELDRDVLCILVQALAELCQSPLCTGDYLQECGAYLDLLLQLQDDMLANQLIDELEEDMVRQHGEA